MYSEKDQILSDDFLQLLSCYKHEPYSYQIDQYDHRNKAQNNNYSEQRMDIEDVGSYQSDKNIKFEQKQKKMNLFLDIKKINEEIDNLRRQEQELILKKNELQQNYEIEKQNFKTIMSINIPTIRQELTEILNIIKKKKVNVSKDAYNINVRNHYSEEEKNQILKVLPYYSYSELSELTKIDRNLLWRWNTKGTLTKKKTGKKIQSQELEDHLLEYLKNQRLNFRKISMKSLQSVAQKKIQELQIQLKGSKGFFQKFCKRNEIKTRRINSKIAKDISEQDLNSFILKFQEKLNSNQYSKDLILNFDETMILQDDFGNYTLTFKNDNHVRVKHKNYKQGYTLGLCISYTGNKLQQHLIWPSKGIKDIFKIDIPENTICSYRPKGSYYDRAIFKIWVRDILKKYVDNIKEEKKGLLIVDNFTGHSYDELESDLKSMNFEILYLPPNSTSKLQPLDLTINSIYKNKYREKREFMQFDQDKISHGDFLEALSQVWDEIEVEKIINSWSIYKKEINQQDEQILDQSQINDSENELIIYEEDDFDDFNEESSDDYDNYSSKEYSLKGYSEEEEEDSLNSLEE